MKNNINPLRMVQWLPSDVKKTTSKFIYANIKVYYDDNLLLKLQFFT